MQTAPRLAVRGLSRNYGGFEALRDLALEIAPGECVAIVGHNGSGKTTAVRTIAGRLEPSAGSVEVAGASFTRSLRRSRPGPRWPSFPIRRRCTRT